MRHFPYYELLDNEKEIEIPYGLEEYIADYILDELEKKEEKERTIVSLSECPLTEWIKEAIEAYEGGAGE